jgi:Domain of unknown function (DUF4252)
MRLVVIAALAGIMLAPTARAQKLELKFDALAAKASDKAEVDLDGALLRLATQHGKAAAGDFLGDVKEVHVRHYEFDKEGSYSDQDLAPLRKQVSEAAGWLRILNVKEKNESTELFVLSQGGKIGSCLILSAEARQLSVVYIMGTLTLAQMRELADSDKLHDLAMAGALLK